MPKGTRLGTTEQDIAFSKFEEQVCFKLYYSRMLGNHQLLCGDDNFVSQRGLFLQVNRER